MKAKNEKRLKKFAKRLSDIRKEKGLSLRQLAAECDVDYAKVSKIETGKANLNLTTLIEIAEGLGMTPSELINIDFD